jgi:hypothetical protein
MVAVKLEATNEEVVNYLNQLWRSNITSPVNNQNTSLIQTLINNNLIGSSQSNNLVENSQSNNLVENSQSNNLVENSQSNNLVQESVELDTREQAVNDQNTSLIQTLINNNLIGSSQSNNLVQESVELDTREQTVNNLAENSQSNNLVQESVELDTREQVYDLPKDDSELINNFPEFETNNKTEFKKQVKENLAKLREIGFKVYHNILLEEEVNLIPKTVTSQDINNVYTFKTTNRLYINSLMKDISRCIIYPKYKYGDKTKPESFRYLINHHNTIKILDRLWCVDLLNKIKDNVPDQQIYKTSLIHRFNSSTSDIAVQNTMSMNSIVLIDIIKAFDSLEWDVLENLLISNLTRKTCTDTAKELVEQYMIILKNREFYYNNQRITISKGISTGLPSSNLVFTLAIEEIIHRWFNKTKYENNKDFIMNVYVDDIYLKFLNKADANNIVTSLIQFLAEYQFYVNKNKSKASRDLTVDISNKLKPTDYYLGIPFTRDIKLYGKLILNEFANNKLYLDWEEIYDELNKDSSNKEVLHNQRIIIGFMNYKLKPFLNNDSTESPKEQIKNVIFNNWVTETNNKMIILITIIFAVIFAVLIIFIMNLL